MTTTIEYVTTLVLEVVFYSLFLIFCRRDGKVYKYFALFSFITLILLYLGTTNVFVYYLFVVLALFGLKYFIKVKTSLYDMLVITVMLLIKVAIETPFYLVLINFGDKYIVALITELIKIILLLAFKNNLSAIYKKFRMKWEHSDFYVRYSFSIASYMCWITAIIFILLFVK